MKSLKWIIVIVSVVAVAMAIFFVAAYLTHFHNGFSSASDDWASFGSYIGGSLGPIFSLLSILAVVYYSRKQLMQAKDSTDDQLKALRIENQVLCLEQRIEECRGRFRQRKIPEDILEIIRLLVSKSFNEEKTIKIETSNKFCIDDDFFIFHDLTGILRGLEEHLKFVGVVYLFGQKEVSYLLSARAALVTEILGYCSQLLSVVEDRLLVNVTLSEIEKECICLCEFKALPLKNLECLQKMRALPAEVSCFLDFKKEISGLLVDWMIARSLSVDDFSVRSCEYQLDDDYVLTYTLVIERFDGEKVVEEEWDWKNYRWQKIIIEKNDK